MLEKVLSYTITYFFVAASMLIIALFWITQAFPLWVTIVETILFSFFAILIIIANKVWQSI